MTVGKRAKSQGMFLWHSKCGGKLYELSGWSPHYYFCSVCQSHVGDGPGSISATWENKSPGRMNDEEG